MYEMSVVIFLALLGGAQLYENRRRGKRERTHRAYDPIQMRTRFRDEE